MSRLNASDRVRRMLSIVPWVAAHDGVSIEEICRRFDIDRDVLIADLNTVSYVGVAPYTPDVQVDVVIEEGKVWIHLPQWFDRPLRLTPEQGLSLVASAQSLLAIPGADSEGPLARGITKIASTLGGGAGDAVEVKLGEASASTLATLDDAIQQRHQVEIEYYTYGRDEVTRRTVDPYRLYADQGQWYLVAYCHLADGERVFRVDRINDVVASAATFSPPPDSPALAVFRPSPDDPRVVLELEPGARWVAEQYPTEHVEERADGRVRVTLAVTARPWLERLLVRLGPDARVIDAPPELAGCAVDAANRILERYRDA